MCFLICLGPTAQAQQREIISVFLKTPPSQDFSLVAHPIILMKRSIAGSLRAAGERCRRAERTLSATWPRLFSRGQLRFRGRRTSWRRDGDLSKPTSKPDEMRDRYCLLGRTAMETGTSRGSYSINLLERKLKPHAAKCHRCTKVFALTRCWTRIGAGGHSWLRGATLGSN